MPRPLKVYAWTGAHTTPGSSSRQSRNIIAATSIAEAMRLSRTRRSFYTWSGCVTGNADEVAQAMSKPGVMFWRPLDDRDAAWIEQKPVES